MFSFFLWKYREKRIYKPAKKKKGIETVLGIYATSSYEETFPCFLHRGGLFFSWLREEIFVLSHFQEMRLFSA